MSDRLAEIEAYCGTEGPWVRVIDGCTFTFHDPPLDIINQRWLIARIHELEAQAEKVVQAELAHRAAWARLGARHNDACRGESVPEAEMHELHATEVNAFIERDDIMDAFIVFITGKPLPEDQ